MTRLSMQHTPPTTSTGCQTRGPHKLYVGVDVAAATVTAAWMAFNEPMSTPVTVAQTAQGYTTLHGRLVATGVAPTDTLVVLEATGAYWLTLATTLVEYGYHVSVINPKQAHNFAKALLKRAKTDAIDAQTLAQLGAMLQPAPWSPPPAIYTELQQRLTHRDALITMRQQLRNQLHALVHQPYVVASVRARLESLIATLTDDLAAVDVEIAAAMQQDAAWAEAAVRLQTITGIGVITTAWLLTATLNFTLCPTPEAATAYAGLAPHAHRSGTSVHKRPTIGHSGNRLCGLSAPRPPIWHQCAQTTHDWAYRACAPPHGPLPGITKCGAAQSGD